MGRKLTPGMLIAVLPLNNLLYRFCKRYVDRYNGENNSDMHTNGELYWLRQVLHQCKVVFDVGANVGNWTAMVLNINPATHMHCFEPSTETFRTLQARSFGQAKVSLHHFGLGESPGKMDLYLFADKAGMNSLYRREGLPVGQMQSEQVHIDTLDAYCEREKIANIDLLKLDVEGHELMVLKGAAGMLSQGKIRRIQFEYGGSYIDARVLLKDMFDLLSSYGYRLYKIYPQHQHLVETYDQRLENFQYQNWAAIYE